MALKPTIPNKQPGKVHITPKTAADYIIRAFDLESQGDAVKFIQDPNGSLHFIIPTDILTRAEIECKLIPYFSKKVEMLKVMQDYKERYCPLQPSLFDFEFD